ncbi:MAG: endo alpha-1,4 polygalactosaminidase, partial [Pseudoruegeria sp.]
MSFSSYALLYSGVDVQQVVDSNVDLLVTEGGAETNFANSAITQAELVTIQANGTQVAGYINMSVTDDSRPYWDASWTEDGTDTGTVTALAPSWLTDQPSNEFGFVVDYTDTAWQDIVIAQAVDLVSSGFDGVFMDDFQQYYVDDATGLTISQNATAMMEFAVKIDEAIKEVNPDAILISNGNPYVVTDAVDGASSTASVNYLEAIDGMLLEIFFGITQTETAAIEQAKEYILGSADVLALEYGGTPYQNHLFQQAAEKAGFLSFSSSDASYSDFGEIADATTSDDNLLGTGLGDDIDAYAGNDTIDAGTGADIVAGGAGADTMDGGEGSDYLNYSASTAGVSIDMATG